MQEALANLMLNRTSFVIAHRLSTVRRADAIVVLEQGVVKEIGRHDELLARPGSVYARLYALQMFEAPAHPGWRPRHRHATRWCASRRKDLMITSMTGFASVTRDRDDVAVSVTIEP